jgi:signal peptidase I
MRTVLAVLAALTLAGCGPSDRNTGVEKKKAPTSSVKYDDALQNALLISLLSEGSYASRIAPTGSMEPWIDSRSVVVIEPTDGKDVRIGQIVVWQVEDSPKILHRVVDANQTHVLTSGVANAQSDGWVPREKVTGRLYAIFYSSP